MPLTATIKVPAGPSKPEAFRVNLRITNQGDRRIEVLNPDMGVPAPAMKWPFSNEIYQISLLISFGYLSMIVSEETGQELPRQTIETWATPVLRPKLELAPGDSFELAIPIGSFYRLVPGRAYRVALEYGDQTLKAGARSLLRIASSS